MTFPLTIGISAAASPFDRKAFDNGVALLKAAGFGVTYHDDIFAEERYLAGNDARRAAEFMKLICNPQVDALMFARGGYGSQRIIPLLNAELIRKNAKPIIGFSDLTALLTWLRQECGCPTFYGPVLTQLGREPSPITVEQLLKTLHEKVHGTMPSAGAKTLKPGKARGKFVGGCLSLICSGIGTSVELDTTDSILFLEDVDEKVYAVDRMLTQLQQSRLLAGVRGIVFGSLTPRKGDAHDMRAMLVDVLGNFAGPVITDFPAGHGDPFITLPLGVAMQLDAPADDTPTLTLETFRA